MAINDNNFPGPNIKVVHGTLSEKTYEEEIQQSQPQVSQETQQEETPVEEEIVATEKVSEEEWLRFQEYKRGYREGAAAVMESRIEVDSEYAMLLAEAHPVRWYRGLPKDQRTAKAKAYMIANIVDDFSKGVGKATINVAGWYIIFDRLRKKFASSAAPTAETE